MYGMEKVFKIQEIEGGGFKAILKATGNVVAEYDHLGQPTKIFDNFNLPVQQFVELIASV